MKLCKPQPEHFRSILAKLEPYLDSPSYLKTESDRYKECYILPDVSAHQGNELGLTEMGFSHNPFCNHWYTCSYKRALKFYEEFGQVDDYLKLFFREEADKRIRLRAMSRATTTDKEYPVREGFKYRDWQRAGIEYLLEADTNVLVADDMRIGKTATALGFMNASKWAKRNLVVCPATVKPVWYKQAMESLLNQNIEIITNRTGINREAYLLITNYDTLHLIDDLYKEPFDIVIADECHLLKSMNARRTSAMRRLEGYCKIGLSGTPLLNNPQDLLNVLSWLDDAYKKYRANKEWIVDDEGMRWSLEDFREELRASMMLRRLQSDVFDEQEPIEVRNIILPNDRVLDILKKEIGGIGDLASIRKSLGLAKVDFALKHIDAYTSGDEKLVVFAHHREVLERLSVSLGNKAVLLYGGDSDAERVAARTRFDKDPTCQVFIGSILAAGVGINLSVANRILFVEQDYSKLMEQALERCSDLGQTKQVTVEFMVFDGSNDLRVLEKLNYKDLLSVRSLN